MEQSQVSPYDKFLVAINRGIAETYLKSAAEGRVVAGQMFLGQVKSDLEKVLSTVPQQIQAPNVVKLRKLAEIVNILGHISKEGGEVSESKVYMGFKGGYRADLLYRFASAYSDNFERIQEGDFGNMMPLRYELRREISTLGLSMRERKKSESGFQQVETKALNLVLKVAKKYMELVDIDFKEAISRIKKH